MVWKQRWSEVPKRNRRWLSGLVSVLLILAIFPWSTDIAVPSVSRAQRQLIIYSPQPAQIQSIHISGSIRSGEILAELDMPDLEARKARTAASVNALSRQLPSLMDTENGLDVQQATMHRLQEQLAETDSIKAEAARLQLKAEFDGEWHDIDPSLREGSWVNPQTPLGVLIDPKGWVIDGYVDQQQVNRIAVGAAATFWPQNWNRPLRAIVVEVDGTRSQQLPYTILDARYGGDIATVPHEKTSQPMHSVYRIRLQLLEPPPQVRELRGTTHIQAERSSWLGRILQNGMAVIIRESGF